MDIKTILDDDLNHLSTEKNQQQSSQDRPIGYSNDNQRRNYLRLRRPKPNVLCCD